MYRKSISLLRLAVPAARFPPRRVAQEAGVQARYQNEATHRQSWTAPEGRMPSTIRHAVAEVLRPSKRQRAETPVRLAPGAPERRRSSPCPRAKSSKWRTVW
jgi:hypothetical protein